MLTFLQGIDAIRRADKLNTDIDPGKCKQRVREAFGIPSNGTPTAAASWRGALDRHPGRQPEDAPAYSFLWFTGGEQGAGHVVVGLGNGRILTPGGPANPDEWYETTVGALLRGWPNLAYAGWTRSIDGRSPTQPIPPRIAPAPAKPSPAVRRPEVVEAAAKLRRVRDTATTARGRAAAQKILDTLRGTFTGTRR